MVEGSLLVLGWSKLQGGVCGLARVVAISENTWARPRLLLLIQI